MNGQADAARSLLRLIAIDGIGDLVFKTNDPRAAKSYAALLARLCAVRDGAL